MINMRLTECQDPSLKNCSLNFFFFTYVQSKLDTMIKLKKLHLVIEHLTTHFTAPCTEHRNQQSAWKSTNYSARMWPFKLAELMFFVLVHFHCDGWQQSKTAIGWDAVKTPSSWLLKVHIWVGVETKLKQKFWDFKIEVLNIWDFQIVPNTGWTLFSGFSSPHLRRGSKITGLTDVSFKS